MSNEWVLQFRDQIVALHQVILFCDLYSLVWVTNVNLNSTCRHNDDGDVDKTSMSIYRTDP